MKLSYSVIQHYFQQHGISIHYTGKKNISYEYMKLYTHGEKPEHEILYFVNHTHALDEEYLVGNGIGIMVSQEYDIESYDLSAKTPILVAKTDDNTAFRLLESCFLLYYQWTLRFMSAFLVKQTLPELLMLIGEIVPDGIVITDDSFGVLASSNLDYGTDEEWKCIKENGYHSPNMVKSFLRNQKFQKCVQNPEVFQYYVQTDILDHYSAHCPICENGKYIALASVVFQTNEILQYEVDLLVEISKMLGHFFSQNGALVTPNILNDNTVKQFLLRENKDTVYYDILQERLCFDPGDGLYVLTLYPEKRRKSDLLLMSRIVDELSRNRKLNYCYTVQIEDYIAIICNETKNGNPRLDNFGMTQDFLNNNQLLAGISNTAYEIELLPHLYEQTKSALRYGLNLEISDSSFVFDNYIGFYLVEKCVRHENLRAVIHPVVAQLEQDTKPESKTLLDTLFYYTMCGFDTAAVARQMYVHRNTVYYRLKRIEELFDIDLTGDAIRQHILISIQILNSEH